MVKLMEYGEQMLVKWYRDANNARLCAASEVKFGQVYVGASAGSVVDDLSNAGLMEWVAPHTLIMTTEGEKTARSLMPKWGDYQEDFRDVEP